MLDTSGSCKPIVGRDLVKMCMAAASTLYEHLDFFAQAKSEGRIWLHWKGRTFSGVEIVGVTVLEVNNEGEITSIGIHQRPLEAICPDVRAFCCIDELARNAHPVP